MQKKSIYSDVKPYLLVAGGLLTVLGVQLNWDKLGWSRSSDNSSNAVFASSQPQQQKPATDAKAEAVKTQAKSDADKPPKEGKIKRITKVVDRWLGKDPDKKAKSTGHWGYSPENGPEKWGDLAAANGSCKNGKAQSPINLVSHKLESGFEPLFYYKKTGGEIVNNGHTLKIIVEPGSFLRVLGKDYQLKQFHFHTMAEHKIDGRRYPMAAHLVHESAEGNIVVVAIMFQPGLNDQNYNMLVDRLPLPEKAGTRLKITGMDVDPAVMLPPRYNRTYFTYDGSLTTPPCTENIGWIILKTPVYTTLARINRMNKIMKPNFRPIQNLNGRHVMYAH